MSFSSPISDDCGYQLDKPRKYRSTGLKMKSEICCKKHNMTMKMVFRPLKKPRKRVERLETNPCCICGAAIVRPGLVPRLKIWV